MNVAILGPAHPWRGGIAHHSASLFRALKAAGHGVRLYNFSRLYPEIFFPGKTQKDESSRAFSVPAEAIYDPVDPRSWLALGRRLRAAAPERLVVQWWHPFFAPGYAAVCAQARLMGCEVVMLCHNVEPHEASPVDRLLLQMAYAFPTRFIAQSGAEADRLGEILRGGWRKEAEIEVVAHPRYDIFAEDAPAMSRDEARRRYKITARHSLLFFGLVRPYKGLDILLEAVAKLPGALDFELRVVGEIYEGAEDYRAQIERLGLADRVCLDDRYVPNEEVPQIFAAADVCILPYRNATGSGVANVALACGTQLVMSRLATLAQAFSATPVRWFEPGDPEALAEAIERALGSPGADTPAGAPMDNGWQALVDAIIR